MLRLGLQILFISYLVGRYWYIFCWIVNEIKIEHANEHLYLSSRTNMVYKESFKLNDGRESFISYNFGGGDEVWSF